jgi:type II secretion system protein I
MKIVRCKVESRRSKVESAIRADAPTGDSAFDLRPSTFDLSPSGFVLIEVMIAVAIFAMAVLALGEGVRNCIAAQIAQEDDARAVRVLENRMAEIELGAVPLQDSTTEDLKEPFKGMKLKTTRVQLKKKNEKEQDLFGLYTVNLDLIWKSDGVPQERVLSFYYFPRQR